MSTKILIEVNDDGTATVEWNGHPITQLLQLGLLVSAKEGFREAKVLLHDNDRGWGEAERIKRPGVEVHLAKPVSLECNGPPKPRERKPGDVTVTVNGLPFHTDDRLASHQTVLGWVKALGLGKLPKASKVTYDYAEGRGMKAGTLVRDQNAIPLEEGMIFTAVAEEVPIVVNGRPMRLAAGMVTYESVLFWAGEKPGASVTYKYARDDARKGGILSMDSKPIELEAGMVFNAIMTGNA